MTEVEGQISSSSDNLEIETYTRYTMGSGIHRPFRPIATLVKSMACLLPPRLWIVQTVRLLQRTEVLLASQMNLTVLI